MTSMNRLMRESPARTRQDERALPEYCGMALTPQDIRVAAKADAEGKIRTCCAQLLRGEPLGQHWRAALVDLKAQWDADHASLHPSARSYTDNRALGPLLQARLSEAKRLMAAGTFRERGRTQERLDALEGRVEELERRLTAANGQHLGLRSEFRGG
jgi:hypothetical protein